MSKQVELIKMPIFSTLKKGKNKKSFRAYYTKMKIVVSGEEEKGKQLKSLTVKFRSDVKHEDVKRGYLYLNDNQLNAPFKYEITDEVGEDGAKTGKKVYPCAWIRGYEKYVEVIRTHNQDDFEVEEDEDPYAIPDEEDEKNFEIKEED